MKYKEMLSYIDKKPDAIGFLHRDEISYFADKGVNVKGLSYHQIMCLVTCLYEKKKISNKIASDLITLAYNANTLNF